MKRTFIIRNIIIAIVIIAVITGIVFFLNSKKDLEYEVIKIENYNYFVVKNDQLSGVMDKNGKIIIEPQYDEVVIPNPESPLFVCYKDKEIKILNENKQELYTNYEKVEPIRLQNVTGGLMYEKTVLKYQKNGKYGLIDLQGKKVVNAKYDDIEGLSYKEGELIVQEEGKYGVINIKGKSLVNPKYDDITVDSFYTEEDGYKYAGYIVSNTTEEGYRYGYIDYKGKPVLQPEYNEISRITDVGNKDEMYLIVARNGQYGLLKGSERLLPYEYQSIVYDENNKLLTTEKSKKYGVATLEGKTIIPEEYEQIDINGANIYASNEEGITVFDTKGQKSELEANVVILNTNNEKYKIQIRNDDGTKYSIIGQDGKQIVEQQYSYIEYLYGNYFRVSNENSQLGIIDDKGDVKIEINNDSLQQIEKSNLIQTVKLEDQSVALYTKDMKKIGELQNAKIDIKPKYVEIYNDKEIRYFDYEGKELKPQEVFPQNKLFAKSEDDKWGFVDSNGKFVVQATYDRVTEFNEYGFAGVKTGDKWGVIDSNGEEILEPTYSLDGLEITDISFINKYYKAEDGYGEVYYTDYHEETED